MLRVTIDEKPVEMPAGSTILDALRAAGLDLPAACHDDRLKPYGACRLCLVRVNGEQKPVTSCNTALTDGMAIDSRPVDVEAERRTLLKMLARNYPAEALRSQPDKPFHRWLRQYGLESEARGVTDPTRVDETNPYFRVDMSQCIACFRCVRICDEVQGSFVWQVWNRGSETRIVPDSGSTMAKSTCTSCGACVDSCPTGALEDKTVLAMGMPENWTRTTCPYCGVGCEMEVGTRSGRIVTMRPAQDAPVNHGHLCVKGRYAHEYVYAGDRITEPMIRRNGQWARVSWDEAIRTTATELQRILEKHGPDCVGMLGSSRSPNEDNYITQKFARVVLGTNNVDCCARVCHTPTAAALKAMLGTGAATNSYDDIEVARTILLSGSNATENHPIVGARIKQAVRRGAKLIVVDPRKIELTEFADFHLQLHPGTNVPLLNAMACVIVQEMLYDEAFVTARVDDWDQFRRFALDWTPERAAPICGVDAQRIREAARLYATRKPAMCLHGLGMTEHVQGTQGVMCLVNLALLTGNIGKPGTGINPLRGQNNVQGSAHMGCEPSNLTGAVSIKDGKEHFENVWGAPVPDRSGLNIMKMLDAAEQGRFKALWTIGYDLFLTMANANRTRKQMEALELVVVQDLFLNETAKEFGHVFLPACSSFERDGTFMNAERRVQRVRKAIEPLGESKPDWDIVQRIARAMGKGEHFAFCSTREIWEEVRKVWKAGAGMRYERMEVGGLQWPCTSEDDPGTQILHAEKFPIGERAALRRIPFKPTPEAISPEFPFLLNTGRSLYQFNAGTMTGRTKNVLIRPNDTLDMSPGDAERSGLREGEKVRVVSRHGVAVLPLAIDPRVREGELFATFHSPELFLNLVTGCQRDRYVGAPEYKVTAVRVERADGQANG